jgi:two-component system, OmpR family, sensor histidine kinase BaeS
MKLKFRHKVFLIFLLNSLVIIGCMLLIARHYVSRNFENYVQKMEMERLDELTKILGKEYRKSGGWEPVVRNFGQWLETVVLGPRGPHPPGEDIPGRPPGLPPFPPNPTGPPPEGETMPRMEPPPPPPHQNFRQRLALFDSEKRPLTGSHTATENFYFKPVLVDGREVGWLGLKKSDHLTNPLDTEFIKLQSRIFYSIGGVALLLAIIVTAVLSRHILAPLRELAQGTRALTSRKFETRIEVGSSDEFGQLATDFNDMAQALEKYEQNRRQWIADISHELRTPLAILRGEIEAMQDGVRQITREALDSLHFEVEHLAGLVHDLHELSSIESQTFRTEQKAINPLEALEDTLEIYDPRLRNRGIRMERSGLNTKDITVLADAGRLKQLFSNLLENALRYTRVPGVLTVSCERKADQLLIFFEDSGPGVPEEALEHLFDRLYRVDKARSRSQGGSGLGLAICRSIMESFGGRIEASNAPAGGLRITMYFPLFYGEIPSKIS